MAMEDGATLVSVPRDLFISFIAAKPRTLQIYLHKVHLPALHGHLWIVIASSHNFHCLSIKEWRASPAGACDVLSASHRTHLHARIGCHVQTDVTGQEMPASQAMARLWRVAHFVLTDFLELSLEEMPARLTAYPPGIPATAPSALTASMHLGVLPEAVIIPVPSTVCRVACLLPHGGLWTR